MAPVLPGPARRRDIMSSSLRCMAALEKLARSPYGYTLSEIAAALEVNLTTTHRVLSTLLESGFIAQDRRDRKYRIAAKLLWVGTAYLRRSSVYLASFAVIEDLASRSQMMAHVAAWEDNELFYLHAAGPPDSLNLFSQIGERIAMHGTGLGKAVLAWRPEEEFHRLFAAPLERYTEHTITEPGRMKLELQRIRKHGYAIDQEESGLGMRCVAAPVRDHSGSVVAAISISAPAIELKDRNIPKYVRHVLEASLRISVQLGYRPSSGSLAAGRYRK
ncbi:MAG: IclR family transcriptional regulator [Acidobacteriia bacterium]|nr:IclR family transcriptional regulator [Terriglobia bacterium]